MSRHFRRYCFSLAERLGMTVTDLLNKANSAELSEWMAYDLTQSEDWKKKQAHTSELDAAKQMSKEDRIAAFKRMFKGTDVNNSKSTSTN